MKKIIFQEGKQKSVTKNITVCSTTGDRDVAFHLLKKKKKKAEIREWDGELLWPGDIHITITQVPFVEDWTITIYKLGENSENKPCVK